MERKKFFPYSWHIDEDEEDITSIRIYGLDEKDENVCVRVDDFTPYVYVELPDRINWDAGKAQLVGNKLDELLNEQKPIKKVLMMKKKLYGAHLNADGKRKLFPYLLCSFSHRRDIKTLGYRLRRTIHIVGVGAVKLKMHEADADEILQLTCCRQIPTAGWVNFQGKRQPDIDKVTLCDHEFKVKWKNLSPLESNKIARPKILSFDIETNSTNPASFPDAHRPGDKVFQISCVLCRYGDTPDKYEKYLLTLGQPDQAITGEDVLIYMYDTEAALLEAFAEFIQEENPNLIVGYNILGFDIPYMIERAKHNLCIFNFDRQGFHKFAHAREKTIKWSSSAYGTQEFQFLDAEGRVYVDLLPLVKRDFKFNNYKLKTVAEHFVGATKDPLSVKGIFKCYRIGTKKNKNGEYSAMAQRAMGICGKYCVKDSELVCLLVDKLQTWVGLTEMAKTCNVSIFTLYTQGQQIKVYSQLYRHCMYENIVVESDAYQVSENERYIGAHVFPPVPGRYKNIIPFDFASLYPTTIIAYNIDYHTWVPDDSDIPDSKCHVMTWSDHHGCSHDPKVIRKVELTNYINAEEEKLKKKRAKRDSLTLEYFKSSEKISASDARGMRTKEKQKINDDIKKCIDDLKPYKTERSELNKSKPKFPMCAKRFYRFLKEPRGVLPTVIQNLLDARKHTRKVDMVNCRNKIKELESKDGDHSNEIEELKNLLPVLDKRQLAYKVSANSVSSVTPIPCQIDGKFVYRTIEELSQGDWKRINAEQEVSTPIAEIKVWSDQGFTKPKYIMRHPRERVLKRVITHTGFVDCTEDHSLLTPDGNEVKPIDINIGDDLMHHKYPMPLDTLSEPLYRTITDKTIRDYALETKDMELAFVHGLFFAEGTCGTWGNLGKAKSSWIIYNQDHELLSRAKDILNKYEGEFIITDYYESARVYHLKPIKTIKPLCEKYRKLFYDHRKYKRIPDYILTSKLSVRQAFFMGYYAGDGNRKKEIGVIITNKGQIGTASLMYLANSLGYKVSISNGKNGDIYRLQCSENFRSKKSTHIKSIRDAPFPEPVRQIREDIVRNDECIQFNKGESNYRNIKILCQRFPRQKLLDSLDDAAHCADKRHSYITMYQTNGKKVTYRKYCCGKEYTVTLRTLKAGYTDTKDCSCDKSSITCAYSYNTLDKHVHTEHTEYVYDIETENHHFAAGIGHMIVHNSMYGAAGVRRGYLPCMPVAMCTTYMGRVNIERTADTIVKKFGGKLVYGD